MTFELLKKIIEKNNVPESVHLMSDSGWECDPTEMDGVYYNASDNIIVFGQYVGHHDRDRENEGYVCINRGEEWGLDYE